MKIGTITTAILTYLIGRKPTPTVFNFWHAIIIFVDQVIIGVNLQCTCFILYFLQITKHSKTRKVSNDYKTLRDYVTCTCNILSILVIDSSSKPNWYKKDKSYYSSWLWIALEIFFAISIKSKFHFAKQDKLIKMFWIEYE